MQVHPLSAALRKLFSQIHHFSSKEVRQLLHNKFVVILGDSIHRTIYKDLVCFLQSEEQLTSHELKVKLNGSILQKNVGTLPFDRLNPLEEVLEAIGIVDLSWFPPSWSDLLFAQNPFLRGRETFRNDHRVEGGTQHNKTNYREVRQYRTDHHLVRVYFITRAYSDYMESILEDFRAGPAPDLLILNSCLWDLDRYNDYSSNEPPLKKAFREYRENLYVLFGKLHDILPSSCLVIWNTAMPVAPQVTKAHLEEGMENLATPEDVLRANFEGAILACCYQFDVLDLNFYFRFLREHRAADGVHWDMLVHRCITKLLLTHVADAWGVKLKKKRPLNRIAWNGNAADEHPLPQYPPPPPPPPLLWPPRWRSPHTSYVSGPPTTHFNPGHDPSFQYDSVSGCGSFSGFISFDDVCEPPAHLEETQHDSFDGPPDHVPGGEWGAPAPFPPDPVPEEEWGASAPFPPDHVPGGEWGAPAPFPPDPVPEEGWGVLFPSHVDYVPNGGQGHFPPLPHRSPRGFRGRHRSGWVTRHQRFYREPYFRPCHDARGHPPFEASPYKGWRGR